MSDSPLHERYNAFYPPGKATLEFRHQLSQAFLSPEDNESFLANPDDPKLLGLVNAGFVKLLVELGPIFWKGVAGNDLPKFEIWLIHGHYTIGEAEKMVSRLEGGSLLDDGRDIMELMPTSSLSLPVERWDFNGQALEFRTFDADDADVISVPPAELQTEFKRVMDARDITALGLAVAPGAEFRERLSQGHRFMERTGCILRDNEKNSHLGPRAHVTTFEYPEEEGALQIAWIPCNPNSTPSTPNNLRWLRFATDANDLVVPEPATTLSMCATHSCQNGGHE